MKTMIQKCEKISIIFKNKKSIQRGLKNKILLILDLSLHWSTKTVEKKTNHMIVSKEVYYNSPMECISVKILFSKIPSMTKRPPQVEN